MKGTKLMQFKHAQYLIAHAVKELGPELAARLREQARFHAETAINPARSGYGMVGALDMATDCARAACKVDEGNWGAIMVDGVGMLACTFNSAAYLCGLSPDERKALSATLTTEA
jgi:hypothetical protein